MEEKKELKVVEKKSYSENFLMSEIGQEMQRFDLTQRKAIMFSRSTLVPKEYQGADNVGNVVIALGMAKRLGADPLMVMQNLYIVYGKPSWSSTFLIATVNQCGRFAPLRYETKGTENTDGYAMRAYSYETTDKDHKDPLYGEWVSLGLAKKEGWYDKKGSKWKTMPGQMLRYRAASWWTKVFAPELAMGLTTSDESEDIRVEDAEFEEIKPERVSFEPAVDVEPKEEEVKKEEVKKEEVKEEKAEKAAPKTAKQLFG